MKQFKFTWFDWFCLWYPPGWLILFNRHWQHYHADPDGWNWLEYALFLIPGGFYLALFIRWLRIGCRLPRQGNSKFDTHYQQAFRDEVLDRIAKYYFRAELKLVENLPETGPLMVVMNHAGMCFPWDFLVLAYLLGKTRSWSVQPLAGVSLFEHPWMIWWLPRGWVQILGGVRAELDEFEAAVSRQIILLYAPEGLRGPGKSWWERYQLQTFHPSFIKLSDRYGIPILPVICLGNEYLNPWAIPFKALARRLSLPFLPISPLMFFFGLFPSMGVWAMPIRLRYYLQTVNNFGLEKPVNFISNSNNNRNNFYQRAQALREKMQFEIDRLRSPKE